MKKTELIEEVAKRTGVSLSAARTMVEATLDVISENPPQGHRVRSSFFGRVGLKKRNQRQSIQPRIGKPLHTRQAVTQVFSQRKRPKNIVITARGLKDDDDDFEKTNDPGEFIKGIKS